MLWMQNNRSTSVRSDSRSSRVWLVMGWGVLFSVLIFFIQIAGYDPHGIYRSVQQWQSVIDQVSEPSYLSPLLAATFQGVLLWQLSCIGKYWKNEIRSVQAILNLLL